MSATTHKWSCVPLTAIAEIERTAVSPENIKSGTRYVGLENMTSSGQFVGVGEVANGDLASTKFAFTNNHILYGKLRPYLAKIARPDFSGVCSTDILPILPGPKVDRGFLLHFLRQPQMVDYASSRTSGANLPRLSPKALAEFEVPLPPLPEQKRIADILDKADAILRKRQETVTTFTQLAMASFRKLFGTSPEATWKSKPFGELVESTQLGIVRGAKEMSDQYPFPYLRMDALIGDGDIKFEPIKRVRATPEEAEQFRLRAGDFLFNTRNSRELVGKTAVLHEEHQPPLLFNNNIMRVRFGSEIDPVYMNYLLQLPQMQYLLEQRKSGTTSVFAVYYKNLKDLPIPVAPIALQRNFASFVTSMLKWRSHCRDAAKESQAFFDSLVQRAFKGEL